MTCSTVPIPRLNIPRSVLVSISSEFGKLVLTGNSVKVTDGPNGARGGSFYKMSE